MRIALETSMSALVNGIAVTRDAHTPPTPLGTHVRERIRGGFFS